MMLNGKYRLWSFGTVSLIPICHSWAVIPLIPFLIPFCPIPYHSCSLKWQSRSCRLSIMDLTATLSIKTQSETEKKKITGTFEKCLPKLFFVSDSFNYFSIVCLLQFFVLLWFKKDFGLTKLDGVDKTYFCFMYNFE